MTSVQRIVKNSVRGAALLFALLMLPLNGTVSANEATPSVTSQDKSLKEAWKKLQAAVKAGKMTEEEAKKKMALIKKKQMETKKKEHHLKELWKKLQAAVKAGKMTEEEAKKKMAEAKKKTKKKKPTKKKSSS